MSGNRPYRILHVHDEPDIREIAKLALEGMGGFLVLSCASGAEALDAAADFKPDLILLDVMMPEMDGPTILKSMQSRRELAEFRVVFMTAKVQNREIEQYKALGAIDVISKPFDPMTLSDEVCQIYARGPH